MFPSIFHEFKNQRLINKLATRFNLDTNSLEKWTSNFSEFEMSIMEKVNDVYGGMTGFDLSRITHRKDSPWFKAWKEGGHIRGFSISNEEIRKYFQEKMEKYG